MPQKDDANKKPLDPSNPMGIENPLNKSHHKNMEFIIKNPAHKKGTNPEEEHEQEIEKNIRPKSGS